MVVAVGAAYFYFNIIQPFRHLKEALRRLADHDFGPTLLSAPRGIFGETNRHVRRISEMLQQLDRQITDEGFSLRAILSSMVEGVLITDRAQRIRLVNEPLQKMFDFRHSPINRTVIEVFCHHELQLAVDRALRGGKPQRIELSIQTSGPDGYTVKFFTVHAAGLNPLAPSRPLGAVVVFHDITAVRNLEAVRREFMANVSHEFRTPLAIINGYLETLLDGALEDRAMAEKFLRVMQKNGQRLTLLIEDLMTISRMEQGRAQLDFQSADLPAVLQRVIEGLEPAIEERHAQVRIEWARDAATAEIDSRRIEQVFANLLENALRHGRAEQLVVEILGCRNGEGIEIVFSDNGPGIPYEDQPHIFERFYRVHKDRSRLAGGTGLGLSIVKHVVEAHGGSVGVESVPGSGAAFKIRLPAVQTPATSILPAQPVDSPQAL